MTPAEREFLARHLRGMAEACAALVTRHAKNPAAADVFLTRLAAYEAGARVFETQTTEVEA